MFTLVVLKYVTYILKYICDILSKFMLSTYAAYSRELAAEEDLSEVTGSDLDHDEYLSTTDFLMIEDLQCRPKTKKRYDNAKDGLAKQMLGENAVLRCEKDGGISSCKTWRNMVSYHIYTHTYIHNKQQQAATSSNKQHTHIYTHTD
jgi:hypothetical protein